MTVATYREAVDFVRRLAASSQCDQCQERNPDPHAYCLASEAREIIARADAAALAEGPDGQAS